jgi:RNA polymerase sigma factor (sigma-70 family)
MADGYTLLREYATRGDERAFGELVAQYMDLVYSAALRQVGGDDSLAEDVAQTVFADLARKAKSFSPDVRLGGWLYRRSCFIAQTTLRTEIRRKAREQAELAMNDLITGPEDEGWRHIAPVLDEVMNRLSPIDRDALVLRFFERQPLRAVGLALGTSENAARMRVERALERLRQLLAKRGVTSTTAALAVVLANQAITAAPVGIVAGVTGASLASAAASASGITTTVLQLMTFTKLKLGIIGLCVAAGVTTPLVVQYQHNAKLGRENLALRQQIAQLATIRDAAEQLPDLKSDPNDSEARHKQLLELERLRAMIAAQRRLETELRKKLEAAESQADLAKFERDMGMSGPRTSSASVLKATAWSEKFEIAKLQPAGRETAVASAQTALYAAFHGGLDAFYDLFYMTDGDQRLTTPAKSEEQDRSFKETLAQMRQMWGGDAAQGINDLKMGPIEVGSLADRYMVVFAIDYGSSGRPTGAPTHGSITLHQTSDGWKVGGFGSSGAPTMP